MMQKDNFRIANLTLDERILFLNAFNLTETDYIRHYNEPILNICIGYDDYRKKLALYRKFLAKREKGFSVSAIVGKKDFYRSTFFVNENVLIPRPETETLVEYTIEKVIPELIKNKTDSCNKINNNNTIDALNVLDICTGSGCIGISLLKDCILRNINTSFTLSDKSELALEIAHKNYINIIKNNIENNYSNTKYTLEIINSDLFDNIKENSKFDLVVSNPPYVKQSDYNDLQIEVKKEPKIALIGGEDGLDIIRRLISDSSAFLKPSGVLLFEFGIGEENDIFELLNSNILYRNIRIINDLTDRPRFAYASRV